MPIPLVRLDTALIQRPKTTALAALGRRVSATIGHELALQALTMAVLLARFLAWLLFWPAMLLTFACFGAAVLFGANGMWWDVVPCLIYGPLVFAAWGGLFRFGGGVSVPVVRKTRTFLLAPDRTHAGI